MLQAGNQTGQGATRRASSMSLSQSSQLSMTDPLGLGLDDNPSMDSFLDFSECETATPPTPSSIKNVIPRPTVAVPTAPASLLSTPSPAFTGPSHQYNAFRQQTGIVPGGLEAALAVNPPYPMVAYNSGLEDMSYLTSSNGEVNDQFDLDSSPNQQQAFFDIELDLANSTISSADLLFPPSAVSPGELSSQGSLSPFSSSVPTMTPTTSNVGRLWPGMHQEAAQAKSKSLAQQRQQQMIMQQQRLQRQSAEQPQPQAQAKRRSPEIQSGQAGPQRPPDALVQQKIGQLLRSMRDAPPDTATSPSPSHTALARMKKDEEDMDEDERLLASEEGKKLSSKERRQLRNKVSARAFRSRRKEYISHLEAEIAKLVKENGAYQSQNRNLTLENERLQNLTRMLLGSPAFSDFLRDMSTDPSSLSPTPPSQVEQRQERQERQAPKDVNPYSSGHMFQQQQQQQQQQPQQMEITMNSEPAINLSADPAFNYQPQVFTATLPTQDAAFEAIESSVLSGKSSNFVGSSFHSDSEDEQKVDAPVIKHPAESKGDAGVQAVPEALEVADEEFDKDPLFALYRDDSPLTADSSKTEDSSSEVAEVAQPLELNTEVMANIDLFGGIEPEKVLSRFELVDSSASKQEVCEAKDAVLLARIERIANNMEAILSRLDMMTPDAR